MNKFRFLLFIFGFMLCMIPNVNAETVNFREDNIRSFTYCRKDGTCEYDVSLPVVLSNSGNHAYRGANLNMQHRLLQININSNTFSGLNDGDTFSFYMYDSRSNFYMLSYLTSTDGSNQYYFSVNNNNSFLPLVTFNNYGCNVNIYGLGQSESDGTPIREFYVTCPYKKSDFDYDFIQSYYVNSNESSSRFFGLSHFYVSRSNETTIKDIEKGVNDLNDTISSSDTSESQSQASSFFDNFQTDTYGLSDIITMPLTLIRSLTNSTCVSLNLTIPFVNKKLELPCMSSIYSQYFGSFFNLYQMVTFGFVAYWVVVRIFNLVKDFKNPDHDEIEVLDL